MDRSKATYEAFDGVELRLLNDRVVRCPPIGVGEAVRYLRLMSRIVEDFEAHHQFMTEFPERISIANVPLADLGFSMKAPDGADVDASLTLRTVLDLLHKLSDAGAGDPGAQADFLDDFLPAIGLENEAFTPAEVFEFGRLFAQEVYALVYGLASDFSAHLATSPRGQVTMILERAKTTPLLKPVLTT